MRNVLALALAVVCMVRLSGCGYNSVITADETVKGAWAEVQSQYQRRADLVPNLVNTVKGAARFEQETLAAVTEARARATSVQLDPSIVDDPARHAQFQAAQQQLSGALGRLLAVAESYPDLKASAAFRGTENRIAVARGRYVQAVADYNSLVQRFPSMIGAKVRGKTVRPTFSVTTPGADVAPRVEFSP